MAIYTLADMQAASRRSSSIPRQYHRIAEAERDHHRFSVVDAVELKLRLQALNTAVSGATEALRSGRDMANTTDIDEAVHLQSPHGAVYVAGSEEFFLAVKTISRPDLIPNVYAQACKAMLQGKPYVNTYHVSDFNKGVDPTFSEIRRLLPDIDRACETDLEGAVAQLETQVAPFPFLRLPAELRLQVYSHVLPHEPRSLTPHWIRKVSRPRLTLMRVNHQLHHEVRKYFYEHVTLSLPSNFHLEGTSLLESGLTLVVDTIQSMNPDIFPLLKRLSIHISGYSHTTTFDRNRPPPPTILKHVFNTFTSLDGLVITFGFVPPFYPWTGQRQLSPQQQSAQQRYVQQIKVGIIEQIPRSVKVSWPREVAGKFFHSSDVEQQLWRSIQERGLPDTPG